MLGWEDPRHGSRKLVSLDEVFPSLPRPWAWELGRATLSPTAAAPTAPGWAGRWDVSWLSQGLSSALRACPAATKKLKGLRNER